jgi:hypothetical protein
MFLPSVFSPVIAPRDPVNQTGRAAINARLGLRFDSYALGKVALVISSLVLAFQSQVPGRHYQPFAGTQMYELCG